jgi:hypothetical protein
VRAEDLHMDVSQRVGYVVQRRRGVVNRRAVIVIEDDAHTESHRSEFEQAQDAVW